MADPLSFVASVIAVTSLAGNVATKGYRYIKAVKDCRDDVRSLMTEVNVLCGILQRLVVLLRYNKLKSGPRTNVEDYGADSEESADSGSSHGSGNETESASGILQPPDFIYECQRTLFEIENILNKFSGPKPLPLEPTSKQPRHTLSRLRRLEPKDLKWPLTRSKTLQLIEALERHKSTCTIALAKDSVVGIYAALEQTKLSNRHLAELKAKQEMVLELAITQEEEKALAWLSVVDPAFKLQELRRERQRGTGTWLFDLPEFSHWLETPTGALWIYGIPGAGKTMLSTLVVDEVLTRTRSKSVGTAYFYIRHDDQNSHRTSNVLGSIISQLARQHPSAIAEVMELYAQHLSQRSVSTPPEDDKLVEVLCTIFAHFTEIYIMIDGLDECGPTFDAGRKRLINTVAAIHRNTESKVRTLVFSRDELDIRKRLCTVGFQLVSIAASSADIRLFASAWLPSLEVRSQNLRTEIVDTLVDEANGMFMWVRAQIDYLQRLPNDLEKRKALKMLPPDLPQTYNRIFETIHGTYPDQTRKLIQRALKWMVLAEMPFGRWRDRFKPDGLCLAICVENSHEWPLIEAIPSVEEIFRWLGCLISKGGNRDEIHFSHFSIKEYLTMDPEKLSSPIARKYLVLPEDRDYLAYSCLSYVMHDHFKHTVCSTLEALDRFGSNDPLYGYIATTLCEHIWRSNAYDSDQEEHHLLGQFLSIPPCRSYKLWDFYDTMTELHDADAARREKVSLSNARSPLQFASFNGLTHQLKLLLTNGEDPNGTKVSDWESIPPLHLAICSENRRGIFGVFQEPHLLSFAYLDQVSMDDELPGHERGLQATKVLIDFGADVNRQLTLNESSADWPGKVRITPLAMAVVCARWKTANLLLLAGARWDMTADQEAESMVDLCSIERLLIRLPRLSATVQRVVELGGHDELKEFLDQWEPPQAGEAYGSPQAASPAGPSLDPQSCFTDACRNADWGRARELLELRPSIDVNYHDDDGLGAIHWASNTEEGSALLFLLENGADPNLLSSRHQTPLGQASSRGCLENMRILLKSGANIEHQDSSGYTALLVAIDFGQFSAMELLLNAGANPHAVLNDGINALRLAVRRQSTTMFSTLVSRGVNPHVPDNYGTVSLHEACLQRLYSVVENILDLCNESMSSVDYDSLIFGTPLYIAVAEGLTNIADLLLKHGATIDKVGPGNTLGSAMMVACAYGHTDLVKLLLSKGASLEVEGSRFLSAAGTSKAFRREDVLRVLNERTSETSASEGKQNLDVIHT